MLPPGSDKLLTKPLPIGSDTAANKIGIVRVSCCKAAVAGSNSSNSSGLSAVNSFANTLTRSRSPAAHRGCILKVTTLYPAERIEALAKCYVPDFCLRIILSEKTQNPEAVKAIPLLGMEDGGPNRRSAHYNRDELAPSHRLLQKGPTVLFSTLATKGIERDSGRLLSH